MSPSSPYNFGLISGPSICHQNQPPFTPQWGSAASKVKCTWKKLILERCWSLFYCPLYSDMLLGLELFFSTHKHPLFSGPAQFQISFLIVFISTRTFVISRVRILFSLRTETEMKITSVYSFVSNRKTCSYKLYLVKLKCEDMVRCWRRKMLVKNLLFYLDLVRI